MKYTISYVNRRGAYCTKSVDSVDMNKTLKALRCAGDIYCGGKQVGTIWKDGKRWNWCYEECE